MSSQSAPPSTDEAFLNTKAINIGFAIRHFAPEIEVDYQRFAYHGYQQTRRVALALLILSLIAFFCFDLIASYELGDSQIILPVMLLRLAALLIILVAANRLLRNQDIATGERWIPIVLGSLSVTMLIITLLYYQVLELLQLPFGLEGMMLIQMAIFFPIGYSYRNSLCLGVATLIFTYVAVHLGTPSSLSTQLHVSLAYLLVASIAAGAAGYCQEHSMRTLYLVRCALRSSAETDGLTQLYNRRTFDLLFQRALQEAQHTHKRVALIMLDLDHFKAYNDFYGHPAGDLALKKISTVLTSYTRREMDFAARVGGEEFAVVLYNPDKEFLATTCEGIRQQIHSGLAIEHLKSPSKLMTASLGASFNQPYDTTTSLYQRADKALYRAKGNGRNCVEID